jgi:predicted CoA-binding protein
MKFVNPAPEQIAALLGSARTIAVVGLSDNPSRPSFDVAKALQKYGYRIVPVSPTIAEWLDIPAFATLTEAVAGLGPSHPIDIVNVFRRPEHVDAIVDECIHLDLPALWLQMGVINEPAALRAQQADMTVIMDKCIKVERMRLTQ